MNYIKYIFNRKNVMQTINDLEMEIERLRLERNEEKNRRILKEKDNREIGNKVIVALEEIKDLKKENKRLKRQLKETK